MSKKYRVAELTEFFQRSFDDVMKELDRLLEWTDTIDVDYKKAGLLSDMNEALSKRTKKINSKMEKVLAKHGVEGGVR